MYHYTITQNFAKYLMKSATRLFWEYGACKFRATVVRSERVAFIVTPERATIQERRGLLPERAHEVYVPKACVGSEKIAEDIWIFSSKEQKTEISGLNFRCTRQTPQYKQPRTLWYD
jgi:hypothetical protein